MRNLIIIFIALLLSGLAGCQTYHPKPLTTASVEQSLTPPPNEVLKVRASELKHPLLPPVQLDLNDGLSPDEAAVLAVLLNPALRARRDRSQEAQAQLTQAGLLPNPQLGYALDVPTGGQTQGTTTAFGLSLGWDAVQLITRSTRQEMAEENLRAVDLEVAWQEWQTAMAAKQSVYRLYSLQTRIALLREAEQDLARRLAVVRRATQGRLATAGDLAAASAIWDQARSRRLDLQKQEGQERAKLLRLLGLPASSRLRLGAGTNLPQNAKPPEAARLLGGIEQRRLDLVALRRGYGSQEAAVHAAILNQFPRINLGLTHAGDTSDVITTGFAISIDLPIFDRNQAKIAQERATRQRLFDEYVDRVAQARSDVARFLAAMDNLNRQVAAALTARADLRLLEQNYREAMQKNFIARVDYDGILDQLTQKRLEVIDLEGQLMESKIALELASGFYELDAAGTGEGHILNLETGGQR